MSEKTVLESDAGEHVNDFAMRLVRARPATGTFNSIELDVPGGASPTLLADALAIIYALKLRNKHLEAAMCGISYDDRFQERECQ